MVVYTLEQRWEILRHYFENHGNVLVKTIIFSDEAHFDLGGYVKKQNCSIWGTEIPHVYVEKPTQPTRVTVWCGLWSRAITGPFFFKNGQGEAVTLNGDRYWAMLNEFLVTKLIFIEPKRKPFFLYVNQRSACWKIFVYKNWREGYCRKRRKLARVHEKPMHPKRVTVWCGFWSKA